MVGGRVWGRGISPLEIGNEAITFVRVKEWCRAVRVVWRFSPPPPFFSFFFFSFFVARPGTEVENCPGDLLLRFSPELLARDSGSWLGALWPSFYLEAQLRPPPSPSGREG